MDKNKQQAALSWLFMIALFVLCGILGFLQYRWIGQVSVAARERLLGNLQASLNRISQEFNSEIGGACAAIVPVDPHPTARALEAAVTERYEEWRKSYRYPALWNRIAVVESKGDELILRQLDLKQFGFSPMQWPETWDRARNRLEARLLREPFENRPRPGLGVEPGPFVFDLGVLERFPPDSPQPPGRREVSAVILELNGEYVRNTLLPELVRRHLGNEYQVEVVRRMGSPGVIYQSDPSKGFVSNQADASVPLLEVLPEQMMRRWAAIAAAAAENAGPTGGLPPGRRFDRPPGRESSGRASGRVFPGATAMQRRPEASQLPGAGATEAVPVDGRTRPPQGAGGPPGRGPRAEFSRWQMFVRHHAGSLETVVAHTRQRNLAVMAGVLLLILAAAGALVRFTRRAQRLAELQMDFVAGVSHELRTPLAVIHTAAYNLRGAVARNPLQVERYGGLIQQESGRLKDLVEQILRFAGVEAGRAVQETELLSVEALFQETVEASKPFTQASDCTVEMTVQPGLPLVMGDRVALKHALQNLLSNAAKYGAGTTNWIGLSASMNGGKQQNVVEIRVADRGRGIPHDEQRHIFDPFFRGTHAIREQIHGTGLGLSLAKRIIEAHGGTIQVKSAPEQGTEFVVRIPVGARGASA